MIGLKWWHLSWLNVARNTRRSLIAVLIIASGSCALMLAAGFVFASFDGLRESTIQGGLGHLQIAPPGAFDDMQAAQQGFSTEQTLALTDTIKALPQVRLTTNRVLFEGLISNGDITIAGFGRGVEIANERKITLFTPIVQGRNLRASDDPYSAVLGVDLARNLKVKPGDSVMLLTTTQYQGINAIDVTVVGINRSGVPDIDKRSVMIPLEAAQVLKDGEVVNRVVVSLHETADTDAVARQISEQLSEVDKRTWDELFPFYGSVVTLYRNIFGVMGGIILLVVFLSVSNTMVMTVMERVNESGTMRAFGYTPGRVIRLFGQEGLILGVGGALIGLLVATALIFIVNLANIEMPPPPGRNQGYPLVLNWELYPAFGIFAAMTFCGWIAALFPARRMTRTSIINALNHY